MNLLRLADGPQGAVIAGSVGPPLLARLGEGLLLGVRPEDVTLSERAVADHVVVPAIIAAVRVSRRRFSTVTCTVGSEAIALRAPGRVALPIGAPVDLAWPHDVLHLFDARSGRPARRSLGRARHDMFTRRRHHRQLIENGGMICVLASISRCGRRRRFCLSGVAGGRDEPQLLLPGRRRRADHQRIIADGMVADFREGQSRRQDQGDYTGTYQESITKAMTP